MFISVQYLCRHKGVLWQIIQSTCHRPKRASVRAPVVLPCPCRFSLCLLVKLWVTPPCVFTELPGPPTNMAISNIGSRSVTLQFKPGYDGKTSISRWQVEAQVSCWVMFGV